MQARVFRGALGALNGVSSISVSPGLSPASLGTLGVRTKHPAQVVPGLAWSASGCFARRRNRRWGIAGLGALVAGLAAFTLAPWAQAEPTASPQAPMKVLSDAKRYEVTLSTSPSPAPLNDMFSANLEIVDPAHRDREITDLVVGVDAGMPAHHHGMQTSPKVTRIGVNHYLVKGLLFHMAGDWELKVELKQGQLTDQATFAIDVE